MALSGFSSGTKGVNDMPKISVVIPTYNRAHLLPECINSVLDQTFRDFEIIVIDDGSTDNTREVVSAFPVIYLWQENQRLPGARNKGSELAQGEYIAFLDSDDVLLKNALEKSVEVLDRHPEAGFSYGQAYLVDENSRIFGLEKPNSKHSSVRNGLEEIKDFLIFGNHVTESTLVVRRSYLEDVGGFDVTFRLGSSGLEFWVRLAKRYAVAYLAEPLAKFRFHSQNFCSGRSLSEWEASNSFIIESIFSDAELGPLVSHLRPVAYFRLYSALGARACTRGDTKTARDYLYRAWRVHPGSSFKYLGLKWMFLFAKTWLPQPVLTLARSGKRHIRSTTLPQLPTKP
jgi:glycosyltransferase involved in cell wall biosynthesis